MFREKVIKQKCGQILHVDKTGPITFNYLTKVCLINDTGEYVIQNRLICSYLSSSCIVMHH